MALVLEEGGAVGLDWGVAVNEVDGFDTVSGVVVVVILENE